MNNLIKELRIVKEKCIKDHYDKLNTCRPIQMSYNDLFDREEYKVDGVPFLFIKRRETVKDSSVEYIDLTDYWLDLKGDRNGNKNRTTNL